MATALRPMLLRQALTAPTKRALTTAAISTSSALPSLRTQLLRRNSPWLSQRAAFRTTPRRNILPPLPQVIKGTINTASEVHDPEPTHGSYHWTFERLISLSLVPLTITPFAAGALSPILDSVFIGAILLHTYIGFQSCITDYFPKWRVPLVRKLFDWANFLALFVVGWGFYEFETNDVGLTAGVARVWKA